MASCHDGGIQESQTVPQIALEFGDISLERPREGDVVGDYYSDLGKKSRSLVRGPAKHKRFPKKQVKRGGV